MKKPVKVIVVMGSQSDLHVMKGATELLTDFGISVSTEILSAHRTPHLLEKCAGEWETSGVKVIIAGAGGAAHLPGMLASFSILPVIGVPVATRTLNGLDSLLSIVQMPKGIPVATVAIDNSANAALLALEILALDNSSDGQKIRKRVIGYKKSISRQVQNDRKKLGRVGISRFLKRDK